MKPGSGRTSWLDDLAGIGRHCDALLLDQWGVLHDGARAYPGALARLQQFRADGLRIVILSNSGRSGAENGALLARMGFPVDLYDTVVSAGDVARAAIREPIDEFHARLGRRCLLLARDSDARMADGLPCDVLPARIESVRQADFLLLMSMEPPAQSVAGWTPILAAAAARDLPMVCGNPDLHRVTPDGRLLEAPGRVAAFYRSLGGRVRQHGKPDPAVYRHCLALPALAGIDPARVIAIGDSMPHDVAGASGVGLRTVLVAGGIHAATLLQADGRPAPQAAVEALCEMHGCRPDWIVPALR